MQKTIDFLKKYKKILIAGFIALILVLLGSGFFLLSSLKHELNETNDRQLRKIYEKSMELTGRQQQFSDLIEQPVRRELSVLGNLLSLEPDDRFDHAYLEKITGDLYSLDNLIVLDADRELIDCVGETSAADYKSAYYDSLFSGSEGEFVSVSNDAGDGTQTGCIAGNGYYLLTQSSGSGNRFAGVNEQTQWKIAKMAVGLDTNSSFAVIRKSDSGIIYTDEKELEAVSLVLQESASGTIQIETRDYMIQYYDPEGEDLRLLALTSESAINGRIRSNVLIITGIFLFVMVLLISYVVCLREDKIDPEQEYQFRGKYFLHYQTSGFKALAILLAVFAAAAYFLLTNLNENGYDLAYLSNESEKCSEVLSIFEAYNSDLTGYRDESMFGYGRAAGRFLNKHEIYAVKAGMAQLAKALDIEYLSAVDADGQMICTSSPLDNLNILEDPESPLYGLRYALAGKEGIVVEDIPEWLDQGDVLFGVPRRNTDGVADGLILVTAKAGMTDKIKAALDNSSFDLLEANRCEDGSVVFLVDNYGVILSENAPDTGDDAIDQNTLKNGYCGTLYINGKPYLASVTYLPSSGRYLYVVIPGGWFSKGILESTLILLIMYTIIALWIWYDGLGSKYHFEQRYSKMKDADDWQRTELYWEELTISAKMNRILCVCIYVISALLAVVLILIRQGTLRSETVDAVIGSNWNQSVNGYSIAVNIGIICLFFSSIRLIHYFLEKIDKVAGDDGNTGCRLIGSILDYIGALVCMLVVLTNFGVDAITAIASVGIIGLALSFGAQELVRDMIAGMFLLFEGNFKVGDMIEMGGNWYWIKAIGVRTTTLDAWGSVKVVNNSQMTGIVNIQNASDVVNCDVWIDARYDIDKVAEILNEEVPAIKAIFPPNVATPEYKGIQGFNSNGTEIRIRTYCPPLNSGSVGRKLRYQVKNILDSHDIKLATECYVIKTQPIDPNELKPSEADKGSDAG